MASNWNKLLDTLFAHNLTVAEHRLALTIARYTLGWNRPTGNYIGRKEIRATGGLDGRTFERARDGLIEKGLLAYTPGSPGAGNRGYYALILDSEKAALERPIQDKEKAALQRPLLEGEKGRSTASQKAALQRPRRVKPVRERLPDDLNDLRRQAFDAYTGSGGNLQLEKERGALARSVTSLANAGTPPAEIINAARDLGRNREFPGLLKQRVAEINARGGPCKWHGLDRVGLTPAQLAECDCVRCQKWLVARTTPVASTP